RGGRDSRIAAFDAPRPDEKARYQITSDARPPHRRCLPPEIGHPQTRLKTAIRRGIPCPTRNGAAPPSLLSVSPGSQFLLIPFPAEHFRVRAEPSIQLGKRVAVLDNLKGVVGDEKQGNTIERNLVERRCGGDTRVAANRRY